MCRLGSTVARLKLKGMDGDPHKRWSMWFNSTINEKPHQALKIYCKRTETCDLRGCRTGAAWLSSARVVRCTVKSENERNPHRVLNIHTKPPSLRRRKAGMTSSQHGSYGLGYTRATMGRNNGLPSREAELIPTKLPSVQIGV